MKKFPTQSNVLSRLVDAQQANKMIGDAISECEPFLAARYGSFEGRICARFLYKNGLYTDRLRYHAAFNAGICNANSATLDSFSELYLHAAQEADLLAIFNFPNQERLALRNDHSAFMPLDAFNPIALWYQKVTPWTQALAGGTLLVVHPFASSIEKQFAGRSTNEYLSWLFPDLVLKTYQPVDSSGTTERQPQSWRENLDRQLEDISSIDFDVAMIGAGSYGLPIGEYIKTNGKVAVHIGGATQIYFGILGFRWEKFIKKYNMPLNGWIRPSADETPSYAAKIENGCYW